MDSQNLDLSKCYYSFRNPKIQRVIKEKGIEAFAIYIHLVDLLVDTKDNKLPYFRLPSIAEELDITVKKIDAVLFDYDLFKHIGGNYFSIRQDQPNS